MTSLISRTLEKMEGPVALYPEKETKKRLGVPHRLFKQHAVARTSPSKKKRKRAFGEAPSVFARMRGDRVEVGSEGVVASLIGQIARRAPGRYVSVPGPELIRKKRIRHFVIVTDFIGSGDRVFDYLCSAWIVRSVRSWHSAKLIRFTIFAYSGTQQGVERVEGHPSSPKVVLARDAPTVDTLFNPSDARAIKALCVKYNPAKPEDALGYKDGAVLISFKHGCPNNAPAIFHDDGNGWHPVFPKRTSVAVSNNLTAALGGFDFDAAFTALKCPQYARQPKFRGLPLQNQKLILFLVALRCRAVTVEEQCDRTGLSLYELNALRGLAEKYQLIGANLRLTDVGIGTLDSLLSTPSTAEEKMAKKISSYYYPSQLRVP
jgi:hypothetical protein